MTVTTTPSPDVTVYGAGWCSDCRRTKAFLDEHRVPYTWIDLEKTPEASEIVRQHNNGRQSIPTLVFADGSILTEPSNEELATKLEVEAIVPAPDANKVRSLIIIGSGPSGYTAALYAARASLRPLVYAGVQHGGQLMLTTDVENYPGFEHGIVGPALMASMRAQAERFGAELRDQDVTSVDFSQRPFKVVADGEVEFAESVIVATGAQAKWLGIPGEDTYRGYGVSSCATCDGFFFRNKRITVVGGGDVAMEEAIFLSRFATELDIIHRRDTFRASKAMLLRAQENPKIRFITDTVVEEVLGETDPDTLVGKVTGLRTRNVKTGEEQIMETDALFVAIGHQPNTSIFRGQLPLDAQEYAVGLDAEGTATSIDGVFVAGDVRDHRYRQAVTAAADGCKAAMDAERWLEEKGVSVDHTGEIYAELPGGMVASAVASAT